MVGSSDHKHCRQRAKLESPPMGAILSLHYDIRVIPLSPIELKTGTILIDYAELSVVV